MFLSFFLTSHNSSLSLLSWDPISLGGDKIFWKENTVRNKDLWEQSSLKLIFFNYKIQLKHLGRGDQDYRVRGCGVHLPLQMWDTWNNSHRKPCWKWARTPADNKTAGEFADSGLGQETENQVGTCAPGSGGSGGLPRQKPALVSELVEPQTRCPSPGALCRGDRAPWLHGEPPERGRAGET